MPARLLGTVTLGGLHEKMPTEIGEQARTETLPTPPEGRSDMADMERIMETALKYGTQPLPPSEWWARQELRKLLLEKGAGLKTPAPSLPYSCHKRDGNSCPLTCWHVPCWRGFLASVTPMGNFSAAKGDSSRCYGTPRKRVGGADSHAALLSVPGVGSSEPHLRVGVRASRRSEAASSSASTSKLPVSMSMTTNLPKSPAPRRERTARS